MHRAVGNISLELGESVILITREINLCKLHAIIHSNLILNRKLSDALLNTSHWVVLLEPKFMR